MNGNRPRERSKRLLGELLRSLQIPPLRRAVRETLGQLCNAAFVREVPKEREAFLVGRVAGLEVPSDVESPAADAEGAGSQGRRELVGYREQPIEPAEDFLGRMGIPEVLERDEQFECELGVVVRRPIQGCSHVVALGEDERELERLIVFLRQMG